jgi:hypothetical protein
VGQAVYLNLEKDKALECQLIAVKREDLFREDEHEEIWN